MGYPYPNFCLCAFLGPYKRCIRASWDCSGSLRRQALRALGFCSFEGYVIWGLIKIMGPFWPPRL